MKENYIKIELVSGTPTIKIEYDSPESFQNLMFCLISESGFNLIYKNIEKQLLENNKKDEIEILAALISLVSKDVQDFSSKQILDNNAIINPSSFK